MSSPNRCRTKSHGCVRGVVAEPRVLGGRRRPVLRDEAAAPGAERGRPSPAGGRRRGARGTGELQEKTAQEALAAARARIGSDLSVELVTHSARSVSSGLLDVARERRATVVGLGSPSTGVFGRVSLGGVAERILHSADIPVTLAPRGFDTGTTHARISRITVAFGRADKDSDLLVTAAAVAGRIGATLRVACFAVRPWTAAAGFIEPSAEDLVVKEWVTGLESDIRQALRTDQRAADTGVDLVVGQGGTWADALAAL